MGVSVSSRHSTATTATSSEPPWKKYRPSRAPHRLTHVLSERNIAPARSKWAKYCTFRRAGAKNISRHPTTPHAGAVYLSSQSHPDPQAGQNSPCSAPSAPKREKILPARSKHPKISAFSPAGRIFSRSHPESTPVGRVFSRRWVPQPPHSTCRPPRLKPITPMRVDHCHEMKPLTPLLAQNRQIQAIYRPQRCHGFHAPLAEHPQRHRRFHQTSNQG